MFVSGRARSLHFESHENPLAKHLSTDRACALAGVRRGAGIWMEFAARAKRHFQSDLFGTGFRKHQDFVHRMGRHHCARSCHAALHDHSHLDLLAKTRSRCRKRCAFFSGNTVCNIKASDFPSSCSWHFVRQLNCVWLKCQRFRHSRAVGRPPIENGCHGGL